jgi:hypothetical protein
VSFTIRVTDRSDAPVRTITVDRLPAGLTHVSGGTVQGVRGHRGRRAPLLCCTRFADSALDPFVQLDGCGRVDPADGVDRDDLLFECPGERG